MKGKLVQLSSYGNKLKCFARFRCRVGIVLETAVTGAGNMGYKVLWVGDQTPFFMRIRDIKLAK